MQEKFKEAIEEVRQVVSVGKTLLRGWLKDREEARRDVLQSWPAITEPPGLDNATVLRARLASAKTPDEERRIIDGVVSRYKREQREQRRKTGT